MVFLNRPFFVGCYLILLSIIFGHKYVDKFHILNYLSELYLLWSCLDDKRCDLLWACTDVNKTVNLKGLK